SRSRVVSEGSRMNPLSKHIRTVVSVDLAQIADNLEAMAQEAADWQRVCARLLPRIERESLNLAERVILDVALEKLRAGGGAASAADCTAAVRYPPSVRS